MYSDFSLEVLYDRLYDDCVKRLQDTEELDLMPEKKTRPQQNDLFELNRFFWENRHLITTDRIVTPGVPPGNWYMVTVTCPKGRPDDYIFELHEKFLLYTARKLKVVHAALEKAACWHIHYVCNIKAKHKKNLQRDVSKHLQVIVDVAPKAATPQRWNGLCKYVLKREYSAEKAETAVDVLIDGLEYERGKGYLFLKNKSQDIIDAPNP